MGNLGRAGFGASLDGTVCVLFDALNIEFLYTMLQWPYSYDACDVGTAPNQTINGKPEAALQGGWEVRIPVILQNDTPHSRVSCRAPTSNFLIFLGRGYQGAPAMARAILDPNTPMAVMLAAQRLRLTCLRLKSKIVEARSHKPVNSHHSITHTIGPTPPKTISFQTRRSLSSTATRVPNTSKLLASPPKPIRIAINWVPDARAFTAFSISLGMMMRTSHGFLTTRSLGQ